MTVPTFCFLPGGGFQGSPDSETQSFRIIQVNQIGPLYIWKDTPGSGSAPPTSGQLWPRTV